MHAMILDRPGRALEYREVPVAEPGPGQILVKVHACGVCRTDLHVVDGELPEPKLPIIPGHEIVGSVVRKGSRVESFRTGERIGVPWLGYTCGECRFCREGRENLCDRPLFTGYTIDGGYAEYTVADSRYCFPLPDRYSDTDAAPLLCAGLIGYRSYRMVDADASRIGIYGFGGAAHIVAQVAVYQGKKVFAFTRPGDLQAQRFARKLGAVWAGDSTDTPPEPLDASIIFAPVGSLVPAALRATVKGGIVVCGGIYMSDIPAFPYRILWEERRICSVANLERRDGEEFLALAPGIPVVTETEVFPLKDANEALSRLRDGKLQGAAVLAIE
ncbi:MAG: zinc-dependent alcohol dehydrogenase family protein [Acidobacteria bacterium]|nr:zinc-dependent alcohol dehydrogenase family protein [Acidobacteriota bacterium]